MAIFNSADAVRLLGVQRYRSYVGFADAGGWVTYAALKAAQTQFNALHVQLQQLSPDDPQYMEVLPQLETAKAQYDGMYQVWAGQFPYGYAVGPSGEMVPQLPNPNDLSKLAPNKPPADLFWPAYQATWDQWTNQRVAALQSADTSAALNTGLVATSSGSVTAISPPLLDDISPIYATGDGTMLSPTGTSYVDPGIIAPGQVEVGPSVINFDNLKLYALGAAAALFFFFRRS